MAILDNLVRHYRSARTREQLAALSDRQLTDIGLTRADVHDREVLLKAMKPVGLRGLV
ncbi:MAG: DUF1127 domain-containing protein [Pseudomonadota bacterium]